MLASNTDPKEPGSALGLDVRFGFGESRIIRTGCSPLQIGGWLPSFVPACAATCDCIGLRRTGRNGSIPVITEGFPTE